MSGPTVGGLDPETFERVYKDQVVPESRLHQTTPQEAPRAVVMAGQPGAGKGGLVKAADAEFSKNIVPIDADEQRDFHPDIKKLRESHPYTWSGETHTFAKAASDRLRDDAIAGRRNVALDVTLAGAEPVIKQIQEMPKGYQVEIRAIATHRLESEVGVDQRFTSSLNEKGYGRHVPESFRDFAYRALPGNLDKVHEQTGARVRIYNREGAELYDSRTSPLKPSAAMEQAREARMIDPKLTRLMAHDARQQLEFHKNVPESLAHMPKVSAETAKNLPLEHAANKIAPSIQGTAKEASLVNRVAHGDPVAKLRLGALHLGQADAAIAARPGFQTFAKVAGVAGAGLMVVDAVATSREISQLHAQGNAFGADAALRDLVGRQGGGIVGGALAGGAYGLATGSWSGPGALATGFVGAVVGGYGGSKLAQDYTEHQINNQIGSDNLPYTHTDQGWKRGNAPAPAAQIETLEYKRSSAVTALSMAHPVVHDTQKITLQDAQGHKTAWQGDGANHWRALAPNPAYTPEMQAQDLRTLRNLSNRDVSALHAQTTPPYITTEASPKVAALLNQESADRQFANAHYRETVAKGFAMDYHSHGWSQSGPLPEHVTNALKLPSEQHIKDPATGKVWEATAKGGFERTERTYAPDKYTDSVLAHDATVQASAQETTRLQQAQQQVHAGNASYAAQLTARIQSEAQQQQLKGQQTQTQTPPQSHAAPGGAASAGASTSTTSSSAAAAPATAAQTPIRQAHAENAPTQFAPERPPQAPAPHRPNITPASIPTPGGLGGAGGTNSHDAPKHREDERKAHLQQDAARSTQQAAAAYTPSNAEQALTLAQLHEMASTSQRKDEQAHQSHTPEAPQPAPSSLSFYQREAQQRRDAPEKTSPTPPPLEPAGGYAQPAHPLSAQPNEFGKRYALEQRDRISPEQVAQHAQEQAQMLRGPQSQQSQQSQQPLNRPTQPPQQSQADAPSLEAKTARSARPVGASSYQNHSNEALQPSQQAQQDDKRIDQPGHPGHELFKQARTALDKVNEKRGLTMSDKDANTLAGSLTVAAVRNGLTHIDRVSVSDEGEHMHAIQGHRFDPRSKYGGVHIEQALNTPLEQSAQAFARNQQHGQEKEQAKQQEVALELQQIRERDQQQSQGPVMQMAMAGPGSMGAGGDGGGGG